MWLKPSARVRIRALYFGGMGGIEPPHGISPRRAASLLCLLSYIPSGEMARVASFRLPMNPGCYPP